ncbi:MAG: alcohol dehydrogenase catalytic domain-containing protein [Dissulfurispiraceae bacterium]
MKAVYLTQPGTFEIKEVHTPMPSPGEVLVRIKAALTCGTDLKAFLRGHPLIPMPGLFGHEFSGIIEETGKGVRKLKVGDEVMAVHTAPCLACKFCTKKLYNLCENIMNTKILGAFAEHIVIPQHILRQNVYIKPPHLSFEEAAFLEPRAMALLQPQGRGGKSIEAHRSTLKEKSMRRSFSPRWPAFAACLLIAAVCLWSQTPGPRPLAIPLRCSQGDCPVLTGAPQTTGMRSGFVRLKPGQTVGWHTTGKNEEALVVLHGKGNALIERPSGEQPALPFAAPALVYIPPGTRHNVENTGSDLLEYEYVVAPARAQ